ncbi:hypothetical protein ACFWJU_18020 [Streptomyces mutabilis]|uniref:hypothetical protein n=1 Tax=Streptomyces mutabilis TaxID=67332 RepID=UPI0036693A7D
MGPDAGEGAEPAGVQLDPHPRAAYAVENEGLFAAFGDEVTELAHKLLAAGTQTCEGERDHERIANSI